MHTTHRNDAQLIGAARAGDRAALDELVAAYLPLVYTIARRALDDRADVDDLVQDVMLRALRRLPALRDPESFRPWLTSIAVRQVGTYLERSARAAERMTVLDEADDTADAAFEEAALLRAELSGQRRQARRAGLWLDADDRVLLSLWWLEMADEMSRADLAAALGVSVAHAGVRVQRLRDRLDTARGVVAALDLKPRCPGLAVTLTGWDGEPGPLWRKRADRHIRDCRVCAPAGEGLLPADRLFPVLALLPVPAGLAGAVLGKLAAGKAGLVAAGASVTGGSGVLGLIVQAIGAHPVVAALTAGTLAAGAAVGTAEVVSPPTSPALPVIAAPPGRPSPTPTTLSPGAVSLESADVPGSFVSTARGVAGLAPAGPGSTASVRVTATFEVVEGLADARCHSFRFADGRFLRHSSWRLRFDLPDPSPLFRGDATFCALPGAEAGTIALESSNYPGWFVHRRGAELWVDQSTEAESSFVIRAPLAG
ncbi:sigma-70 family RNA polymerase sigma factor [Catenuloplanes sp. NPDC051500]|uniref:sigma-70 family RNA polymerase sigma factor n=1 Tax=Catenuloplanes sp. NPDC051500 TaxID=3363959 RepID=UPI0037ADAD2F